MNYSQLVFIEKGTRAINALAEGGHVTKEQLDVLRELLSHMHPNEFLTRLMSEGVPADALAHAIAKTMSWPVYNPREVKSQGRSDSYLLGADNFVYVLNPFDSDSLRRLSDSLIDLDIAGWGVVSLSVLSSEDGAGANVIVDPDQSKDFIRDLVIDAYNRGGSDIHIHPRTKQVDIRLRIDGSLAQTKTVDHEQFRDIAGSIMTMCKLNAGEYIRPFDGRFLIQPNPHLRIPVRMSGVEASLDGKRLPKFTLRLLKSKNDLADLTKLGFSTHRLNNQLKAIQESFKKPYGLIIVTGPTGSGKSTTLFAGMRWMIGRRPKDAYYTLEDPVEAELPQAVQIQCFAEEEHGPTFETGLRNLLRQDPDTILLGEIRDKVTASLAVKAANTGHRLLSTLHANTASAAATRLRDIGVDTTLMADALVLLTAQRVIPKVCPSCSKLVSWGDLIADPAGHPALKDMGEDAIERYQEAEARYSKLDFYPKPDTMVRVPSLDGCPDCGHRAVKGRQMVAEVMMIDTDLKKLIAQPHTTEPEIYETAIRNGFKPMWEHAFEMICGGHLSLDHAEMLLGPMPLPKSALIDQSVVEAAPAANMESGELATGRARAVNLVRQGVLPLEQAELIFGPLPELRSSDGSERVEPLPAIAAALAPAAHALEESECKSVGKLVDLQAVRHPQQDFPRGGAAEPARANAAVT